MIGNLSRRERVVVGLALAVAVILGGWLLVVEPILERNRTAGELVPAALRATDRGGSVVLGGIYMSPLPSIPYDLIYGERVVRSVANNTRADGHDFLAEAARLPVRTHTQLFALGEANRALAALKNDAIRGAGVLTVA